MSGVQRTLRVVIAGGGIGGLATAVGCVRNAQSLGMRLVCAKTNAPLAYPAVARHLLPENVDPFAPNEASNNLDAPALSIRVLERQSPSDYDPGYPLLMSPELGVQALTHLGVEIPRSSGQLGMFNSSFQPLIRFAAAKNAPTLPSIGSMTYDEVKESLLKSLPEGVVEYSTKAVAVRPSSSSPSSSSSSSSSDESIPIYLTLESGEEVGADVLIVADGSHSHLRAYLHEHGPLQLLKEIQSKAQQGQRQREVELKEEGKEQGEKEIGVVEMMARLLQIDSKLVEPSSVSPSPSASSSASSSSSPSNSSPSNSSPSSSVSAAKDIDAPRYTGFVTISGTAYHDPVDYDRERTVFKERNQFMNRLMNRPMKSFAHIVADAKEAKASPRDSSKTLQYSIYDRRNRFFFNEPYDSSSHNIKERPDDISRWVGDEDYHPVPLVLRNATSLGFGPGVMVMANHPNKHSQEVQWSVSFKSDKPILSAAERGIDEETWSQEIYQLAIQQAMKFNKGPLLSLLHVTPCEVLEVHHHYEQPLAMRPYPFPLNLTQPPKHSRDMDEQTRDLLHGVRQRTFAGRVTLLGDAAHTTNPVSFSGGNLALADAVELSARIVSEPVLQAMNTSQDAFNSLLPRVLWGYEERMMTRAQGAAATAAGAKKWMHAGPVLSYLRNFCLRLAGSFGRSNLSTASERAARALLERDTPHPAADYATIIANTVPSSEPLAQASATSSSESESSSSPTSAESQPQTTTQDQETPASSEFSATSTPSQAPK